MTLIIVILLLLGYVVIATGHLTGVPLSAGWSISVTAQTS